MLLLYPHRLQSPTTEGQRPLVALFGVGLLGSAIRDALVRRHYRPKLMPLSWEEPDQQRFQLDAIGGRIGTELDGSALGAVSWIWAAGKTGFGSDEEETGRELESFRRVLALAESIARHPRLPTVDFHLLSSNGGLFEGQRYIDRDSVPSVLRPYGDLKLRQEQHLFGSEPTIGRRIYRLTSVFGPAPDGGRRGLIATLIHNGLRQRVTRIVGRLSTLRDFVWTEDIARYLTLELLDVAPRAVAGRPADMTRTLAAGKPSSIHELIKLVESSIGRRLYVQFDFGLDNSMDITVSRSLLPAHWHASDLRTAIRQLQLRVSSVAESP